MAAERWCAERSAQPCARATLSPHTDTSWTVVAVVYCAADRMVVALQSSCQSSCCAWRSFATGNMQRCCLCQAA